MKTEDLKEKDYVRKLYIEKFYKIKDYSEINHINILSQSKNYD